MIAIDPETYNRLKNEFLKTNFKCYSKEYIESAEGQNELEEHLVRRYDHAMNYTIPWVRGCFNLDGKTVLEIGCGSGSISAAFAQFTKHVYGYDIHETSIEAANARVNVLKINNADFILAEPAKIIADIKDKFIHEKVDVVLLHALLEHQTIDERIETLKTAWEIVDDNGIIIVSESPNRFSFYDDHSSLLHFFHMIPDELALLYYQKSPRSGFKDSLSGGLTISQEDALERLARFGRGVSYHEFEIALGDIGDHVILDGYEPEIIQLRGGLREEEVFLYKYITKNKLNIPPAFAKRYLDIVFSKRKLSSQAKAERAARLESIMKTAADEELFNLQKKLLHHESTLSWRITAPLRWGKHHFKTILKRWSSREKV